MSLPTRAIPGAMIGNSVGRGANQALDGIQQARQAMASFNSQIAEARAKYFSLFPDKSGVEAAGARFNELLLQKDLGIMNMAMATRFQQNLFGDSAVIEMGVQLAGMDEDQWDGGIAPIAQGAHGRWMDVVLANLDQGLANLIAGRADLAHALESSSAEYDIYRILRDYHEYQKAGYASEYFPSALSFVQFALRFTFGDYRQSETEMLEIYAWLRDIYGEKALKKAGEILRTSDLTQSARPRNYEALGVPRIHTSPSIALLLLLIAEAEPREAAIGLLRTERNLDGLKDGLAHYDALVDTHGKSKVHEVVKQVLRLKIELDEGKVASGKYKGSTRDEVLLDLLPMDAHVGWERVKARAELRKQDKLGREKAMAEDAQQRLTKQGRRQGESHYDRLLEAHRMAAELDAERGGNSRFAERVIEIAGMWDHYVRTDDGEDAGRASLEAARSLVLAVPYKERDAFVAQLSFTTAYDRFNTDYLIPISQIQQDRINAGLIDADEVVDLTMTPQRRRIENRIASTRSLIVSFERQATQSPIETKYLRQRNFFLKSRMNRYEHELEIYQQGGAAAYYAMSEADSRGMADFHNILAARDLAAVSDHFRLPKLNKDRGRGDLPPLEHHKNKELFTTAAAGLWDGYLRTGDETFLTSVRSALSVARTTESSELFKFVELAKRPEWEKPTAPSVIQRRLIAQGELSPKDALNLDTDPVGYALIWELREKRLALLKILNASYGAGSENKARKLADVVAANEALVAAETALAAYDRANGHSPRLESVTPLPANLPVSSTRLDQPTPAKPNRPLQPNESVPEELVPEEPEVAETADAHLDAFLAAREITRKLDTETLQAINDARRENKIEPIKAFTENTRWLELAAGFWNNYTKGEDTRPKFSAIKALREIDKSAAEAIEQALPFVFAWRDVKADLPPVLETALATRLDTGALTPTDALDLRASREREKLIDKSHRAAAEWRESSLKLAKYIQQGEIESTIRRAQSRADRRLKKLEEAKAAFAAHNDTHDDR